jgi:multiple sugar transport system permease protein
MARAEERLQGQAPRAARTPISPAQRLVRRFTTLMIAPSVLVILVVVAFPLFCSFFLSFTSFTLLKPTPNWVGLDNYSRLLATPLFWQAFGNTMLFLFVTINLEIVLGLLISQLIARTARGQSAIRTLLMIPMMFAPVLVGFQFRWFFNDQLGLVNNALLSLGLIQQSILAGRPHTATVLVMVAASG